VDGSALRGLVLAFILPYSHATILLTRNYAQQTMTDLPWALALFSRHRSKRWLTRGGRRVTAHLYDDMLEHDNICWAVT